MGAGASSASGDAGTLGRRKAKDEKVDLRGERYVVEVDFIAPPENKRLSNNLALYFKGANVYSPRIYPAKVASDQKRGFQHDEGKEFRTKEELKTSTQVIGAKVTALGGNAYRYSFEVSCRSISNSKFFSLGCDGSAEVGLTLFDPLPCFVC